MARKFKLWNNNKGLDYKYQDRVIGEYFEISGTQVFVHRYVGPLDQEGNLIEGTKIQDLLFMESRDRKYDKDIVELYGVYEISDNDFELSQFGFFQSDTLYLDFHLNTMAEKIGRKLSSGDVLELTHLRDDLLEGEDGAINAYFVVEEGRRSAEGYGPTWRPHVWRVRIKKIFDSREFSDILDNAAEDSEDDSFMDLISSHNRLMQSNEAINEEAEEEVPYHEYSEDYIYKPELDGAIPFDETVNIDEVPRRTTFPVDAEDGDYVIRTDYKPSQLFYKNAGKWELVDRKVYREWTPGHEHHDSFVNNDKEFYDGETRGTRQEQTYITNPTKPIIDDDE